MTIDMMTDSLDLDFELDAAIDSEPEYMLVSGREPAPSARSSSNNNNNNNNLTKDSAATTDTQREHPLSLRLVFPSEDGGLLIGKNGRHINKLKETTTATWLISNGHAFEDRIVTISGSVAEIASAVHALAQHILGEKTPVSIKGIKQSEPDDVSAKDRQLTLNMLFPARSIGYILGPGGSRVGELRQKSGVAWLHVSTNTIPFTQERVVQASATANGLETVAATLLHSTKKQLFMLQNSSTLYQPIENGLYTFLDYERHRAGSGSDGSRNTNCRIDSGARATDQSSRKYLDDIFVRGLASTDRSRKRARSMADADTRSSLRRDPLDNKRLRRMSENASSDRRVRHVQPRRPSPQPTRRSASGRSVKHSTGNGGNRRSSYSARSSSRSKEEKLVVSDLIAGRLIGRNGVHLESLKTKSGAEICLSPRVKDMHDRVVTISGSSDSVKAACKLIGESVRTFEDLEA
ncbi:RNA binding protein, heterogenous nuclear RNP-K like protein [Coemansia sp. IMI 203386]|nr:RNA binding protein, heterogenous nuclear RNP-K like protein [Coemansia sp. IMI 203386]